MHILGQDALIFVAIVPSAVICLWRRELVRFFAALIVMLIIISLVTVIATVATHRAGLRCRTGRPRR